MAKLQDLPIEVFYLIIQHYLRDSSQWQEVLAVYGQCVGFNAALKLMALDPEWQPSLKVTKESQVADIRSLLGIIRSLNRPLDLVIMEAQMADSDRSELSRLLHMCRHRIRSLICSGLRSRKSAPKDMARHFLNDINAPADEYFPKLQVFEANNVAEEYWGLGISSSLTELRVKSLDAALVPRHLANLDLRELVLHQSGATSEGPTSLEGVRLPEDFKLSQLHRLVMTGLSLEIAAHFSERLGALTAFLSLQVTVWRNDDLVFMEDVSRNLNTLCQMVVSVECVINYDHNRKVQIKVKGSMRDGTERVNLTVNLWEDPEDLQEMYSLYGLQFPNATELVARVVVINSFDYMDSLLSMVPHPDASNRITEIQAGNADEAGDVEEF